MSMNVLASGRDSHREWFLVGASETLRVFLVIRSGRTEDVRWFMPGTHWHLFEPASAVEANAAREAVADEHPSGSLAWNDIATATAIYRMFRGSGPSDPERGEAPS